VSGPGFAAPASIAELGDVLTAAPRPLRLIAGGTDVLVAGRALPASGTLVDLTRIAAMRGIAVDARYLRIGACTPVAALCREAQVRALLPALADAAAQCGSVQIRNRATIGGNIANAAPAADLVPVLHAAAATLRILTTGGTIADAPIGEYLPDASGAILDVVIPLDPAWNRSGFAKLGPRREVTIAKLNIAICAGFDGTRFGKVRIFAGAVAPRPRRLARVEAALAGRALDAATLRAFADALADEVNEATRGRASNAYKRRAVIGVGMDALAKTVGMDCDAHPFAGFSP
jgi:xanthine dehydrogenase FAD-binding subunit